MLHQKIEAADRSVSGLLVDHVSVRIGATPIVNDVSFHAKPGEVLAIIGPSGSGKTTLLRAMTGELQYIGHVLLSGLEIGDLSPEAQAQIRGVLPQLSQISFPLNVSEVIGLGLIDRQQARRTRLVRIAEALSKVGLAGFEGRNYQDLSGGEQQRVQLARVLCQVWEPVSGDGTPRWLFLDEPVSSLDIKHQYQIMRLAADFAAKGGGVVSVMHDLNLTLTFADRVLVMRKGETLAFGAREKVMRTDLLSRAYDFPLTLTRCAVAGAPIVVPVTGR
ncbi:heme ABC transporter ATP-binding protein [Roseibium sp. SCPC15]|uniref:heme ABC transporter ATP-binding protein n=1 Tax=Roseibium sp. SCP15 TaxID=3141376 RepID=UPI00333DCB53